MVADAWIFLFDAFDLSASYIPNRTLHPKWQNDLNAFIKESPEMGPNETIRGNGPKSGNRTNGAVTSRSYSYKCKIYSNLYPYFLTNIINVKVNYFVCYYLTSKLQD